MIRRRGGRVFALAQVETQYLVPLQAGGVETQDFASLRGGASLPEGTETQFRDTRP